METFGSCATGLYLPSSDVDLVVSVEQAVGSAQETLHRISILLVLFFFFSFVLILGQNQLIKQNEDKNAGGDMFSEVRPLLNASFPIVKLTCTEKYLGRKIDSAATITGRVSTILPTTTLSIVDCRTHGY